MSWEWVAEVRERVLPLAATAQAQAEQWQAQPLGVRALGAVVAVALAAVGIRPIWRVLRLGVTLVHELGHAVIGLLAGRTFTGFVLRADMSGHAITRGPARGPGRVASTWAGYPAPALVGMGLVLAAAHGWAAPVITLVLAILLGVVVRVRSALTAVVLLAVLAGAGALWWWRSDPWQTAVLLTVGLILLIGAWRHLGAVLGDRSAGSDPGVLAALTRVPRALWNASFVLVCALASAVVVRELLALAGVAWP